MSLRVISRQGTKTLYVRGTVRGQSVYESTGTHNRTQAEAYCARRQNELWEEDFYGKKATYTFAHAVESYLDTEPRRDYTVHLVGRLLEHFTTTRLRHIDQDKVDLAYKALLTPNASNSTKLRSVLTPLRAVIKHAAFRGWCDRPTFQTPRQPKPTTPFLRPDQAAALIQNAAPHLRPLLIFLLGTGARMSEALELNWSAVDLFGARAKLDQKQGTQRDADLSPVVVVALSTLPDREGRVFRPARHNGKKLGAAYRTTGRAGGGQIKTGWAAACHRAGLPGEMREWPRSDRSGRPYKRFAPEHTPHVLRHTWASWHYCVHKDMLRLRIDGGWDTIGMCERYAAKIPDVYKEAIVAFWSGGAAKVRETG